MVQVTGRPRTPNTKRKFTMTQVRAIREAYRHPERPAYMTYRFLAKLHNVDQCTIHRMLTDITYPDL